MRTLPLVLVLLVGSAAPAAAQPRIEDCEAYTRFIDAIVKGEDRAVALLDVGQTARCVTLLALQEPTFQDFVRRFEGLRLDEESGNAGGSGTTSAVSQGPVARILSIAAEHGALTQSIADQTVTIRGNLAGLPAALVRKDVFPYCAGREQLTGFCAPASVLSVLRRVSFAVAFDPSRDEATLTATPEDGEDGMARPVTFSASRRELSSASVRVEFWNTRDVTSPDFVEAWKAQVGTAMNAAATDLLEAAGGFAESVSNLPGYEPWRIRSLARVRAAGRDREAVVAALQKSLDELLPVIRSGIPDSAAQARAAISAYSRFFLAQDELIDTLAVKPVLAFEYTNDRPAGQATTSQFRLIADLPLTASTKLVGNAAVSVYNSLPEAATGRIERLRDARFGLQIDRGLGAASIVGPATVSVAVYFQKQNTAALLEVDPANPLPNVDFTAIPSGVSHVFTNTGNIWLAQARLALTPAGQGIKIPLAVTYSNRTELVDEPAWSAQIGLTYDLDSLLSSLAFRRN